MTVYTTTNELPDLKILGSVIVVSLLVGSKVVFDELGYGSIVENPVGSFMVSVELPDEE